MKTRARLAAVVIAAIVAALLLAWMQPAAEPPVAPSTPGTRSEPARAEEPGGFWNVPTQEPSVPTPEPPPDLPAEAKFCAGRAPSDLRMEVVMNWPDSRSAIVPIDVIDPGPDGFWIVPPGELGDEVVSEIRAFEADRTRPYRPTGEIRAFVGDQLASVERGCPDLSKAARFAVVEGTVSNHLDRGTIRIGKLQLPLDADGSFYVEVAAGTYVVQAERLDVVAKAWSDAVTLELAPGDTRTLSMVLDEEMDLTEACAVAVDQLEAIGDERRRLHRKMDELGCKSILDWSPACFETNRAGGDASMRSARLSELYDEHCFP